MMDCLFDSNIFDPDIFDTCDEVSTGGGVPAWWMVGRLPAPDDEDVLIAWFVMEEM
jgi:hypothetical protein